MTSGYSLSALRTEVAELKKDYVAFTTAYDLVRRRIVDSIEAVPKRFPELHTWSGSRAICGAFELSIHAIERTITEHEELIRKLGSGELQNTDPRPVLSLVKETETP